MRTALLIVITLLITGTASAKDSASPQLTDMASFRAAYEGALFAEDAVRDFEEVEKRIGDLVCRLNAEGEVSDKAAGELMCFVQELEREYIVRWYGESGSLSRPTRPSTNATYDSQFREQSRSAQQYRQSVGAEPPATEDEPAEE